jgi:mono/diheme cytochrome c family protein
MLPPRLRSWVYLSSLSIIGTAAILAACSTKSRAAKGAAEVKFLPCDVQNVLAKNCQKCHGETPTSGAPMPLVTLQDLLAPAPSDASKMVYEQVGKRIHDTHKPMPQPPNPRLDDADMKALDNFVAQAAPAEATECTDDVGTGMSAATAFKCSDGETLQHVAPAEPIPILPNTDQYTCFGADVTVDTKHHITMLAPKLDQDKYLHHMLLYQVPHEVNKKPHNCETNRDDWQLVTGWAPGGGPLTLPEEAGMPEKEGVTHFALEIHYSNPGLDDGLIDSTEYQLCATPNLRKYDAAVMRTGSEGFVLPPHSDTTYTCQYTMPDAMDPITIISATPHMHELGRELFVVAPGGLVLGQPNYDYNNQYAFPAHMAIYPGEDLFTVCRWQNDKDRVIKFGETTGTSEMCYSYLTYYPEIKDPSWDWQAPVKQGDCRPSPAPYK